MSPPTSTCWTVIEAAAAGFREERELFARRYDPIVRAYLAARWRGSPRLEDLDDAVQDVFVECFKQGGLLEKAERGHAGGFRAFLYGAARHVALRCEERRAIEAKRRGGTDVDLDLVPAASAELAAAFDRAWARALLREARERHALAAAQSGDAASRRVELLRLRFQEGLAIRDIARLWQDDADRLHQEYARAREEFRAALREVVAFHSPGSPAALDRECAALLGLLG
jgi:RNA polymerase sigma-70 factor (ECF subfamily)